MSLKKTTTWFHNVKEETTNVIFVMCLEYFKRD